jgi:hypothetical protein
MRRRADLNRGHGDHSNTAAHTVTHNGFSQDDVKRMFENAGVGAKFEYKVIGQGFVFSENEKNKRSLFFAKVGRFMEQSGICSPANIRQRCSYAGDL